MGDFQNIFKRLRNSCGLTQAEMAEKIGISRSTIGMYETGAREPDFETLEKIADFFNVDIDYLLGRTDKTTILPETVGQYYLNDEIRQIAQEVFENPEFFDLVENYRAIPNDMQRRLIAYATKLRQLHDAEELLNAAHERTDISDAERTQEAKKAEEDIMDDPNF